MTRGKSASVPDLWWSPTLGVLRKEDGLDGFRVLGGGAGNQWGWFVAQDWPTDAVQLAEHADEFFTKLARQQLDEVMVALGPVYNSERHSWNVGTLARKAAIDIARGGTRTDLDSATVGALARLVLAMDENRRERDELKDRLDVVRAVLDRPWPDDEDHHDFVNQQVEDARAVLRGDQPAEPQLVFVVIADYGTNGASVLRVYDTHPSEATLKAIPIQPSDDAPDSPSAVPGYRGLIVAPAEVEHDQRAEPEGSR